VLHYYRRLRASGLALPRDLVVIAPGTYAGSVALRDVPGREPAVVLLAPNSVTRVRPWADSLPRFLFRNVFMGGNGVALRFSCPLDTFHDWSFFTLAAGLFPALGDAAVRRACRAAESLGLTRQWFSDSFVACFEGTGAAVAISRFSRGIIEISIWAGQEAEARRSRDVFRRSLRVPLRDTPPHRLG